MLMAICEKLTILALLLTNIEGAESTNKTKNPSDVRKYNSLSEGASWCHIGLAISNTPRDQPVWNCCNALDRCDYMAPSEIRNGLQNLGLFPARDCDCAKDFYYCLRRVNSRAADRVGLAYFDVQSQCYDKRYESLECIVMKRKAKMQRCFEYLADNKNMKWQWFDLPFYSTKQLAILNGNVIDARYLSVYDV